MGDDWDDAVAREASDLGEAAGHALVAAGGWCAPSETLYAPAGLIDADAVMLAPSSCPATHPDSDVVHCTLPDRLDRHDNGHQADAHTWPVTDHEHARWTHDCPRPDPVVAWTVLTLLGRDTDDPVPCPCGATWTLHRPTCGDCGRPDGDPTWYRDPPEGGAWDGTFSVPRGGIRFGTDPS